MTRPGGFRVGITKRDKGCAFVLRRALRRALRTSWSYTLTARGLGCCLEVLPVWLNDPVVIQEQWDDPFKNQEPAVIIDGVLMSVFLLLCVTIWCAHIIFVHNGLLG